MGDGGSWRADLDRWLEPFLAELNHVARRTMCPHYIAGLIGLGERKSMQPMAARQDGLSYDRLQHFISVGRWDDAALARALLAEADRMVGGRDAVLVIDDTSLPKKGRHSVGVAPQYLSTRGQDRQLPGHGVAHLGAARGAGAPRAAAVPAHDMDRRRDPHGPGGRARGGAGALHQAGDRAGRGGPRQGRGHPLRPRAG